MKALICYFSGTGNTKKIVDQYVLEGEKLGHQIDTHKIEAKDFPYDVASYDMLGIAYPIHAFNAPSNVVDFVKSLPKMQEKKKLFILKSSGEPLSINNISSYK
ncbi:MAG: hypothetical protein K2N42_05320, partial [Anaeroplasmataceae bacterium]|nr:hypothetical protein [Anaeroplasmataceae bacterium]